MPWLPAKRPMPSQALLKAVTTYLRRRRVIGTRVEVFGPTYLDVSVQAKLQSSAGASTTGLAQRVAAALNEFFDPIIGGPDGSGWPFGRDVYRSEVLQVIDETEGVDHVLSLELVADGGQPQCGNVCLGPTGLVAAGQHQIEVAS
jgi:Baseplate J-like protein